MILIPTDIFKLFEMQEIKMVSKRPEAIQKNRLRELQRWKDHLNINFNIKPKYFPVNFEILQANNCSLQYSTLMKKIKIS